MTDFPESSLAAQLQAARFPRWEDLPQIDLYMDQLVGYINGVYAPLADPAELPLTRSMVNNYVKQKIIPPPEKKKYQRQHLALLILIFALKQVFSLPESVGLIRLAVPGGTLRPKDYDRACQALEEALALASGAELPQPEGSGPLERAALVWANKLYLQKYMEYAQATGRGQ